MKKIIYISVLMIISLAFGQKHTYYFKLQGVQTPAEAKLARTDMRNILNIRVFYFDDETDKFKTSTDWIYNWEDMSAQLALHNYYLDGDVIHLENE